jgi:hypothetical protein
MAADPEEVVHFEEIGINTIGSIAIESVTWVRNQGS